MPYLAFVFAATLGIAVAAQPPHGRRHDAATPAPAVSVRDLYSARAKRRFASYLRMRLLEMRAEGLERAASVVERRLPVDALFVPRR